MDFALSIINGKTVFDIIRARRAECIDVVRDAYLAHARGQSVNPDSYFLRFPEKPDCRIIALPAYLGDGFHVAGLKWIASYPGNVQRGFPRASAVLVLNSYDTGYPFALLESSIISAARTAASAVLAAYWLNGQSRRARSLGIVGTGFIELAARPPVGVVLAIEIGNRPAGAGKVVELPPGDRVANRTLYGVDVLDRWLER